MQPAEITTLEALSARRDELGRIVATSGGYDPIHPGHASCLMASKAHGDTLVAIVNGDAFLREKKGRPFQDVRTRCRIVASVRGVDFVVPFELEDDSTVRVALRTLRPHVFTKGGDRTDVSTIPEWPVCEELGIEIVTGVGLDKEWSSSDFLRAWGEFWLSRHGGGSAGGPASP
jgi:D-beta-D-heptose 7-phosphate kinase/D-beta-D-heptose 1-phosphate adenosyltransferase